MTSYHYGGRMLAMLTLLAVLGNLSLVSVSGVCAQESKDQAWQQALQLKGPIGSNANQLKLTGRFHLVRGTRTGFLILKAEIPEGNYIYSLTQKGAIPPTKIQVKTSPHFKTDGKFKADRTFEVLPKDPVFGIRVEKHKKLVQFYVPIEIANGADPPKIQPEMVLNGQVCSDAGMCIPLRDKRISAKFGGYFDKQTLKKNENGVKR